jgi:hypothetical protein
MEGKIAAVAGSPTLHFPDRPCLRRLATLALITHVLLLGSRSIVVVDIPSETQRHALGVTLVIRTLAPWSDSGASEGADVNRRLKFRTCSW